MFSQKEASKWYFGNKVALDFVTNPPTILANSSMTVLEGCASISNAQGSLLFYTDGSTVWDQTHAIMANGNGLLGNSSSTQSGVIIKKPGSASVFYLFTLDDVGGPDGLNYSIIDMALASGMGSVTVKNSPLYAPSCEKLAAVLHCNNSDVWIVSHEWNSNKFQSHLLTPSGVNSVPVTSAIGSIHTGTIANAVGQMKISPNGKKLGMAIRGSSLIELYDFDNSTGILTNSLTLNNSDMNPYGCEFSPDGSKFYAAGGGPQAGWLYQWDICAGSPSGIISSKTLIPSSPNVFGLQVSPFGGIYVAHNGAQMVGIINNPNLPAPSINYVDMAVPAAVFPRYVNNCFPSFLTSFFRRSSPFTFTATCQSASFTGISGTNTLLSNCVAASYSPAGTTWNFGDPAAGIANSSSLQNPVHFYSAPGTYTPYLVLHFNCYNDTLRQVINITTSSPTFAISGPTAICKGESVILSVNGPDTYSWSTSSANASVIVTPTAANAQYTVTSTSSVTGCSLSKVISIQVKPCLSIYDIENSSFSFYPNPTTGNLFIETEQEAGISIFNNLGRILVCKKILKPKDEVDLSQFSPGLYFMKVEAGLVSKVVRIIKVE
jgi:hypothetical protein